MGKANLQQINLLKQKLHFISETVQDYRDFTNTLATVPSESDLKELQIYLSEITQLKENYCEAFYQLVALGTDIDEFTPSTQFRKSATGLSVAIQLLIEKIDKSQKDNAVHATPAAHNGSFLHSALPTLQIPTFSGKISEYLSFISNFKSIVDGANLDPVQKLLYLKSSLKGETASCVSSLSVTRENYELALQSLESRYNKPKLIIQSHIHNIFELKSVKRPFHTSLQCLVDELNNNIRCLQHLNVSGENLASALISYIIESKLDAESKDCLKRYRPTELLSISELVHFLQNRVSVLTDVGFEPDSKNNIAKGFAKSTKSPSLVAYENKQTKCYLCKGAHFLSNCPTFLELSIEDRIQKVKELRLCNNCLRHASNGTCMSKRTCMQCKRQHHTLLHIAKATKNVPDLTNATALPPLDASSATFVPANHQPLVLTCASQTENSIVLLSTAEVTIADVHGRHHQIRCLLDNGSMNNLITTDLVKRLELPKRTANVSLVGVGGQSTPIAHTVNALFSSKVTKFKKNISCLVIDKISSRIPTISFDVNHLTIPANIRLADPCFNRSSNIDLLIGASHFYDLLCVGQITLGQGDPVLQKTKLGYIVTGRIPSNFPQRRVSNSLLATSNNDFDLQKFWEMENIPTPDPRSLLSKEERICETHFERTIKRANDGKLIVSIPFNSNIEKLGSSYEIALKRFYSLERRLNKNSVTRGLYTNFVREYFDLGHLSPVQSTNLDTFNFLPHHEVLKPTSTTTKLRVVFDGSAKTDSGISLNDCQYVGPVVQNDLFSILLKFRKHRVAITADCAKMYRQIWLTPEQRKFQCILWRDHTSVEVQVFQLNTITYGLTSSSFLATKCLQYLASQHLADFPEAASRLLNDFYMDDLISGADSIPEASQISKEITTILASAGLPLRKFLSNEPTVFQEHFESSVAFDFKDAQSKTLGIQWHPFSDCFQFQASLPVTTFSVTKRQLLSSLATLFDPLGLISPLIITGKLLIQEIWRLQLSWDETIPMALQGKWANFSANLSKTPTLQFPRYIFCNDAESIELHGYADASTLAYGACLYVRSIFSDHVCINILCSKSRVAPLKPVTLPRLELAAAVLLAELSKKVLSIFPNVFKRIFYWSDSQIVLSWLRSAPNQYKTFVANRIATIQELTNSDNWFHCRSADNPADLISRGCSVERLFEENFWFQGPSYLRSPSFVPDSIQKIPVEELPELKNQQTTLVANNEISFVDQLLSRYSSLKKLQRVYAYLLRFTRNTRFPIDNRITGNLTTDELSYALNSLILLVQKSAFSTELSLLRNPHSNHKTCKNQYLSSLSLFLDESELIRVGGRVRHSNLVFDKCHPILLPKGHTLTELIISHYHYKYLHCGPSQLLALVRDNFWPISGLSLCKRIVRKCITCFRSKPKPSYNVMGDLPSSRFAMYQPCFTNTGVDFAGPIVIKDRDTRNPKFVKAYIALFICLTTKAVHLELVTSLSASAFLETFKRFIARRGKPRQMHSDNATNFIAAADEVRSLYRALAEPSVQTQLHNHLAHEGITWKFIPPASPHFGGIWESNVKQTKVHLVKILQNSRLSYEHLHTVLTRIEAILNSRPLSPLSTDPNDFAPLTPSHFLLGCASTQLPEANLQEIPENRLDKFQHRQLLIQHFWRRWSREVVPELQRRLKWKTTSHQQLKIGSLVLLSDDHTHPFQWALARVVEIHPGSDGKVRVVTVRTSRGSVLKRPIVKLCSLPGQ